MGRVSPQKARAAVAAAFRIAPAAAERAAGLLSAGLYSSAFALARQAINGEAKNASHTH
jgi:hypothetical protein